MLVLREFKSYELGIFSVRMCFRKGFIGGSDKVRGVVGEDV